ncbi:MAG: hypothetical protein RIS47_693, partial [Bacteroidota bacterium]
MCLILCKYTQFLLYFKSVYGCDFGWFVCAYGVGLGENFCLERKGVCLMAVGQLVGLPREIMAGDWKVAHGLARIVAVAHSGVMRRGQADGIRLKYNGFQLISYPNARTTSG